MTQYEKFLKGEIPKGVKGPWVQALFHLYEVSPWDDQTKLKEQYPEYFKSDPEQEVEDLKRAKEEQKAIEELQEKIWVLVTNSPQIKQAHSLWEQTVETEIRAFIQGYINSRYLKPYILEDIEEFKYKEIEEGLNHLEIQILTVLCIIATELGLKIPKITK